MPQATQQVEEFQPVQPVVQDFDESQGVAGRVDRIVRADSPLMQTAATRAAQGMNARGLKNSSLAVQAGQQAVIEAAAPIATADASLHQNQALSNQRERSETNRFNATSRQQESQFGRSLMEQAREFDADAGLRRDTLNQQQSQFDSELGFRDRQLVEQGRQANQQSETQRAIASLDANSRRELATIEANYRREISANENVSNAWGTTMQHIAAIQNNPDLDPATKDTLIQNTLNGFRSFVTFWSNTSPGMDVSALLNFGPGGSFSPSGSQAPPAGAGGAQTGVPGTSDVGSGDGAAAAAAGGGPAGSINSGFSTGISNTAASIAGAVVGAPGLGLANAAVNALGQMSAGLSGGHDGVGIGSMGVGAQDGLSAAGVGAAGYGEGNVGASATGPNSEAGYGGGQASESSTTASSDEGGGWGVGYGEDSGGGDGGGKVICAELYRQGRLEEWLYQLDEAFGARLSKQDPRALDGYQRWARPVVRAMQRSRALSDVVARIAQPWTVEMARVMGRGNGSVIGRIMMRVGLPLCRALARPHSAAARVPILGGDGVPPAHPR